MQLSRWLVFVCCTWALSSCAGPRATTAQAPRGFWQPNRFDHNGRAQGRWRTYYDSAKTQPFTAGRYRHGRPVRTFQYYAPTGSLEHTERYRRHGFCEVTHWYPSGQVARRGHAQWLTGRNVSPRFYWFGPWTNYAQDGQVTGIQNYDDGNLTRTETYAGGQLTKAENYQATKLKTVERYENGKLIKTESYEHNVKVRADNP